MCRLQADNYKQIRNKLMTEAKALTMSLFLYLWLSYKNVSVQHGTSQRTQDKQ